MSRIGRSLALILSLLPFGLVAGFTAGTAHAQTSPVVVELYTSQGCSSCPPADAYLAELVARDDVLPLSFHVDYWDRLGWPDTLGSPENTKRQYAYGRSFRNRSVWTPQFVVQGRDYSKGNFRAMVADYIRKQSAHKSGVDLDVSLKDQRLSVAVSGKAKPADILIVHFTPRAKVKIKRGENAGRTITYHNVVNAAYTGATWKGYGAAEATIPLRADPPLAVIIQEDGTGPILAAHVIR